MAWTFDFKKFPMLRTPRLVLRELVPADADDVLVFRGDAHVQRFNSVPLNTREEALEYITEESGNFSQRKGISWALADASSGQVLGGVSLGPWNEWHRWTEIGYDLRRDRWGQGLAKEGVTRILKFAFEALGANRIEAGTIADNHESVRLLERLGFRREGTRRERSLEDDGKFHDSAIYGLLASEHGGPKIDS